MPLSISSSLSCRRDTDDDLGREPQLSAAPLAQGPLLRNQRSDEVGGATGSLLVLAALPRGAGSTLRRRSGEILPQATVPLCFRRPFWVGATWPPRSRRIPIQRACAPSSSPLPLTAGSRVARVSGLTGLRAGEPRGPACCLGPTPSKIQPVLSFFFPRFILFPCKAISGTLL